jgi:hypothetical protein
MPLANRVLEMQQQLLLLPVLLQQCHLSQLLQQQQQRYQAVLQQPLQAALLHLHLVQLPLRALA